MLAKGEEKDSWLFGKPLLSLTSMEGPLMLFRSFGLGVNCNSSIEAWLIFTWVVMNRGCRFDAKIEKKSVPGVENYAKFVN